MLINIQEHSKIVTSSLGFPLLCLLLAWHTLGSQMRIMKLILYIKDLSPDKLNKKKILFQKLLKTENRINTLYWILLMHQCIIEYIYENLHTINAISLPILPLVPRIFPASGAKRYCSCILFRHIFQKPVSACLIAMLLYLPPDIIRECCSYFCPLGFIWSSLLQQMLETDGNGHI